MKRLKSIKNVFYTLFMLVSFISCKDYLEEDMVSNVSEGSYYTTEEGVEDALNAGYSYLKDALYARECGLSLTVFGTDTYANGCDGNNFDLAQYYFDPTQSYLWELWCDMYMAINQCNSVISKIPEVEDIDDAIKNEDMAEARFLRALYYFTLVRQFGDVTLTLEETSAVETEATRTSADSIYKMAIIPDLEYAISILPETQSEYGRVTKGAAELLLSKVYLTYGWLIDDNSAFTESIKYAETVINSGNYSLLDNYADIWDIDNQENSEVVFAVQNSTDILINGDGNHAHLFFLMNYDKLTGMQRSIEYGRPWKRFDPTEYCLSLWNTQYDSRYYKSFQTIWLCNNSETALSQCSVGDTALFMPGVSIGNKYYIADANGNRVEKTLSQSYYDERNDKSMTIYTPEKYTLEIFPTLLKFLDPTRSSINQVSGSRDYFVLRFSEAYLIAAEAYFKTGDNINAAKMLNVIRERAAWPGYKADMDISAADVNIDFILEERARELLGEQQRWYDLTRTGTLIERVKAYCNAMNYANFAKDNITEKHILRPIPQLQIDRCSNDYGQNPGW